MIDRKPEREPRLFKKWNNYTRQRQVMASAVIFKCHGWDEWEVGHAKLFGILMSYYEIEKQISFKYSKTLKKDGYRRTHNYRLLKTIVEKELLHNQGNGYYSFAPSEIQLVKKVLSFIKELDKIGNEMGVKQKSDNTAP